MYDAAAAAAVAVAIVAFLVHLKMHQDRQGKISASFATAAVTSVYAGTSTVLLVHINFHAPRLYAAYVCE